MALVGSTGKSKPNRPSLRVNRKSGTKSSAPMPKPKALPGKAPAFGAATKKATKYLAKSSGTTRGEVKGVLRAVRSGKLSKGGAIKALKGGPKAGVPAGNKKRVARAIRKAR